MAKIIVDKHYNIIKKDGNIYNDEIDRKIDLILGAIEKGDLSKDDGLELLRICLSKELEKSVHILASSTLNLKPRKNPFLFLLNHSSFIERYAA